MSLALDSITHWDLVDLCTGELVWRLLGDLSSDIYAMGIHREAVIALQTPFFLAEVRRRTFVKSYYLSISLSSLVSRPPRILRRYSDCKMPLNLANEEIFLDALQLEQAIGKLTPDGWNTESRYFPTSCIRLRFMAAEVREAVLESEFRPLTQENIVELR